MTQQKDVSCFLPEPTQQATSIQVVINTLEGRLGRLLWNSSIESLRLEDSFDSRLEMQFLAPYYLCVLREVASKDEDKAFTLSQLVHNLLHSYELLLQSWMKRESVTFNVLTSFYSDL